MTPLHITLVTVVGYLIGSISFAVMVAKRRGVNIFDEGSGNPGATNVKRVLGAKLGNTVFVLDALKGLVAARWPILVFGEAGDLGLRLGIVGLVAAIIGHSYSIFIKFRGGKGVATTMGGLLAVMPLVLLIGLAAWALSYFATRIVALASIVFALSLPLSAYFLHYAEDPGDPRFTLGLLLGILIVMRHRSNIARLLQGKENRFKK